MLGAERNRLLIASPAVRRDLQQHIRFLERRLREADDDLHTAVKTSPVWRVKDDLLQSMPGVGRVVSLTLLAELPELGPEPRRAPLWSPRPGPRRALRACAGREPPHR
jgi:transposase